MNCKVCGAPSGKYPLCRACNIKKEKGEIIKCTACGQWHHLSQPCPSPMADVRADAYLYDMRKTLISPKEQEFFNAIRACVPADHHVFPQINLASFIRRTDGARFQNELFRNVDFLITDSAYQPKIVVEINDQSHLNPDRRERDEKVQKICEEAGVPLLKLWTSYGVNAEYIKGKIVEILASGSAKRVHHFRKEPESTYVAPPQVFSPPLRTTRKSGCYVATCVYGSYDCPPVWVLRRYRDASLAKSCFGRAFIHFYYAVSPTLVVWFGKRTWFRRACRTILDKMVVRLLNGGYMDTPYED